MPLTLGLTGMDPETESGLTDAINTANDRLGGLWQLLPESKADYVVVDMDSMYGPMSWLRLHATGKQVIGLTTAPRTQTDFRLERPFDANTVSNLLISLAEAAGVSLEPATASPVAPADASTAAAVPAAAPAPPVTPAAPAPAPTPATPTPAPVAPAAPETPERVSAPARTAAEPMASTAGGLAVWLVDNRIQGRVRFERGGQSILIDAPANQYHAGPALKPLAPLFEGPVSAGDFVPLDDARWRAAAESAGEAQALSRLAWLGGLLAGQGRVVGGYGIDSRFHMVKWPQTEREYPKHFRISTVMMKGPATLGEIAAASGVPEADVADFINANLATGFAEEYREPEPEAEQSKSGLFGRLRGR